MDRAFPRATGEMAELTRNFDWSTTALGPIDQWPPALYSTVAVALQSNYPMFIWWGPELIQFYNDAYRHTMGSERHPSALGQRGRECWEEIWGIVGPQVDSILAGGPATWHEEQLVPVTRDGRRQDVWWTYGYSPIANGDEVGGVLVITTDVTEQHLSRVALSEANAHLQLEAQRRLHESERLRVLFRQAPGFMCILRGAEHVFEFANDAYLQLVGERELLGKRVSEVIPEAQGQGFVELLDVAYRTGKPCVANEQRLVLGEGEAGQRELFLDFVYQPIIESDGSVSGIFVEGSDVTDKMHVRTELSLSRQRLSEGMLAARMTVWEWDLESGHVEFSEHAADILGVELEGLTRPWGWLDRDQAARVDIACQAAVSDCSGFEVVAPFQPEVGDERWIDIRGNVVCDSRGEPQRVRGVTMDVSERKQAEHELQLADRRKDEFLAMLAHELRNPLAPISSAAQLIGMAGGEGTPLRQASSIISRQVDHLSALVDDLLDVSRISRGLVDLDRDPIDVVALVHDAVEQVRPAMTAQRHLFDVDLPTGPVIVLGDRKRLVQVLANVLSNAVKYTQGRGHISLRVVTEPDWIRVVISDDGIGMTPELLLRVFDPFTQGDRSADRSQGGLGIGLSLVSGIVKLHGGSVRASSPGDGEGSTFTISLPRHLLSMPDEIPLLPEPATVVPGQVLDILIVDDNIDAAGSLAMYLEAFGHEVRVEHDSREALALILRVQPQICLLDIGLPEIDGNELARRIRRSPSIRQPVLIAVTGYGDQATRTMAGEAGFDHYLVKPTAPHELLALLERVGGPDASAPRPSAADS